jgi:hypothetical protein
MSEEVVVTVVLYLMMLSILSVSALGAWLFQLSPRPSATSGHAVPPQPHAAVARHSPVWPARRVRLQLVSQRLPSAPPRYEACIATIVISKRWWHTAPPRVRWAALCYALAQHTGAQTQRPVPAIAVRFVTMPALGTRLAQSGMLNTPNAGWVDSVQRGVTTSH